MDKVIVLGAAGFVGASLCEVLRREREVIAVDRILGQAIDMHVDVTSPEFEEIFATDHEYSLVNLVAARTDFGLSAEEYYVANVEATRVMLEVLSDKNVKFFIHMSSVAELDGDRLVYDSLLSADEAYRVTKSMQSQLIRDFCEGNNIPYAIIYPSAIFDGTNRMDTNIGKLKRLAPLLPFIPKIPVKKSLTNLESLCDFVCWIERTRHSGEFLAIESPVQSVTDIMLAVTGPKVVVAVPLLKQVLLGFAEALACLSWMGVDPKLTPNRVIKLFRDTSYQDARDGLDVDSYKELRCP